MQTTQKNVQNHVGILGNLSLMANICHNKQSFCDSAKVPPLWNIFLKEWSSIKIIDWYINHPNEKGTKIKSTKFYFDAHHQPLLSGIMCVFIQET